LALESTRKRIQRVLEGDLAAGRMVTRAIVVVILLNVAVVCLESEPAFAERWRGVFLVVEIVSFAIFTIEYALRLWTAVDRTPYRNLGPARARLRFALSVEGLVDLIAVLPFWLAYVLPVDFRMLLMLRILRFLKLARYSPAMQSLIEALYAERRALSGCIVILMGAALFSATAMHMAEGTAQPDKLGTIPQALWWAIVTLGTVGYGDVVPITSLGRFVAAATILCGLIIMALPIGIIASAFSQQVHRRDFVVTWTMVARVPLFSGLSASEVADILTLLIARRVAAGEIIARRGSEADSMFFIVEGEVEIMLAGRKMQLGPGHFFGEVALLQRSRRTGTSTALTRADLLILQARDLNALMERNAHIRSHIREVAEARLGHEIASARGDIIAEEIGES
jgi:voltage-gated potassium channel